MLTPLELVQKEFGLPFVPYKFQTEVVNNLAPLSHSGMYMDVGTGKTVTSTCIGLYKGAIGEVDQVVVLMPPILLLSWYRWISSIEGVDAVIYRGTPKQRKKIPLTADFILMSIQIFKNDYEYLTKEFKNTKQFVIVDEAASIRNIKTKNHKKLRTFVATRDFTLLTGTAISNPGQCFGYIRLIAPDTYRSKRQFDSLHIMEKDFFGQVSEWQNLKMLSENMMINSVRVHAEDVLDLPQIIYDPVFYELGTKHQAIYTKLISERLLELPDGQVIDATIAQRLYNMSQKIILNPGEFGAEDIKPNGLQVADELLTELNGEKLIIFNNYRVTNRTMPEYFKKLKPLQAFGEISPKNKEKNLDLFLGDPEHTLLIASPKSIGVGLNMQGACRCIIFMELPITPNDFTQAVGRVYRDGQEKHVIIKIAIAINTIQHSLFHKLMDKDDILQEVMPTKKTLRSLLTGDYYKNR